MKYYLALCMFVLAVLVGGCATTSAPVQPQIVAAGPVSGPCPYCGQGITVPATGSVPCPYCKAIVRLAQPAPVAAPVRTAPSVVLPQTVTVVTGGGGDRGRDYYPIPIPIPSGRGYCGDEYLAYRYHNGYRGDGRRQVRRW